MHGAQDTLISFFSSPFGCRCSPSLIFLFCLGVLSSFWLSLDSFFSTGAVVAFSVRTMIFGFGSADSARLED